jgi:alanine racemase
VSLRALVRVNLAAIERNSSRLRSELGSGVELAAVVKADAYGHGALPCAVAALRGGATWLAVASAEEALALRRGGVGTRVLVMGSIADEEIDTALEADADLVAWRESFVARLGERGSARVHVKLDSGMGRLGTRDPVEADRVVAAVAEHPALELAGLMTHFATADELGDTFFEEQLGRFTAWAQDQRRHHPGVIVHAANSAGTLRDPASHFDLVRCGIAVYGMDPFGEDPGARDLEPALELSSAVADVKPCAPGESAGYGRSFIASEPTSLAVLPIGYGDGWRRSLSNNADVLIGGWRRPLVGTVSMDNVTIDVGDPGPGEPTAVRPGQKAVLIGTQGAERITAEEVAHRLGTINYEVTCGLLPRVERRYHRDGTPAPEGLVGA